MAKSLRNMTILFLGLVQIAVYFSLGLIHFSIFQSVFPFNSSFLFTFLKSPAMHAFLPFLQQQRNYNLNRKDNARQSHTCSAQLWVTLFRMEKSCELFFASSRDRSGSQGYRDLAMSYNGTGELF